MTLKSLNHLRIRIFLALFLVFIISFTFGALTQRVFSYQNNLNLLTTQATTDTTLTREEAPMQNVYSREKPSPGDWVKESEIKVYDDRVVLEIENPQWARFTNTNSMDPLFDEDSNAIEIVPSNPEMISPGDIVSFNYKEDTIIHRVIKTGYDEQGWYMITKGDNNAQADPVKIRFVDVQRLVVAIIY
ncbi:hypothetical protein GOV05_00365 [Candidatus Woesearchaeota archaeon]|nr:hypothetical protein [Candidatus Woesearchaeota archaeon]